MIMHTTEKLHSPAKYVKINTVNADAMISVMNEVKSGNIYDKLNKIQLLTQIVTMIRVQTIHMPNNLVKFNRCKHKNST